MPMKFTSDITLGTVIQLVVLLFICIAFFAQMPTRAEIDKIKEHAAQADIRTAIQETQLKIIHEDLLLIQAQISKAIIESKRK